MACVDACRHNALKVTEKWNLLYPEVDTQACIECKMCEKVCPVVTPLNNDFDLHQAVPAAVWSLDDKVRLNAASGGFCTAMAIDTIKQGGVVATCIWKDGKAQYILTGDEEEIFAAANSKYIQSNAAGIYRSAREALKKGIKVLFVGLPCQVAGLKKFLREKAYENLTTIELICSAAPSTEAVKMQEKHVGEGTLSRFRLKYDLLLWQRDYNVVLTNGDHNVVLTNGDHNVVCNLGTPQNIFYSIFSSLLTARYSCMQCQYAKPNRVADYTAGDFHGYRDGDSSKGVSLVICKGQSQFERLKQMQSLYIQPTTLSRALASNSRLYCGFDAMLYHPGNVFRNAFNKLPPALRRQMLLNRMPYRLAWGAFKALTKVAIKIKWKKVQKEYLK